MPSQRNAVQAPGAPIPDGNYSHVIRTRDLLFVAGWMGDSPTDGTIVPGSIESQTIQAIKNIKPCIEAAGSSLDKVVSRRIYMINMSEFRIVARVWGEMLEKPWPVSTCIQVSELAKEGALVELDVVAEA